MAKHTESAGGVVLNHKGEILVVSQHGDSWSLPKGHLDEGETARQAAEREICEESGVCQVEYIKDLGSYERFRIGKGGTIDESELKHITMYLYRAISGDASPQGDEHPEVRWVAREDVADLLTHPKDQEFFRGILGQL